MNVDTLTSFSGEKVSHFSCRYKGLNILAPRSLDSLVATLLSGSLERLFTDHNYHLIGSPMVSRNRAHKVHADSGRVLDDLVRIVIQRIQNLPVQQKPGGFIQMARMKTGLTLWTGRSCSPIQ